MTIRAAAGRGRRWRAAAIVGAGLLLAGCASTPTGTTPTATGAASERATASTEGGDDATGTEGSPGAGSTGDPGGGSGSGDDRSGDSGPGGGDGSGGTEAEAFDWSLPPGDDSVGAGELGGYARLQECSGAVQWLEERWADFVSPRNLLIYLAGAYVCQGDTATGGAYQARAETEYGLGGIDRWPNVCSVHRSVLSVLRQVPRDGVACPGGAAPPWKWDETHSRRDNPLTPEDESEVPEEGDTGATDGGEDAGTTNGGGDGTGGGAGEPPNGGTGDGTGGGADEPTDQGTDGTAEDRDGDADGGTGDGESAP